MNFSINERQEFIDALLRSVARVISPSESKSELFKRRYDALTTFLDNSPELAPYHPVLRVQGSFRLGTIVIPFNFDDGMDVDIVLELRSLPTSFTQQDLKELVLGVFHNHPVYGKMLKTPEGGRRCITLNYSDGSHIDILPCAISDDYVRCLREKDPSPECFDLAITDRNHPGYTWDTRRWNWYQSNPIALASWFLKEARKDEVKFKGAVALMIRAQIEAFPKYQPPQNKKALQQIVILLKRYRDVMYNGDKDAPISMILTTLATKAIANSTAGGFYAIFCEAVSRMPLLVRCENGKYVVANPTNSEENFADKWNEIPRKKDLFFEMMAKLKADLEKLPMLNMVEMDNQLMRMFGERSIQKLIRERGESGHDGLRNKTLGISPITGGITASTERITSPSHTFLAGTIQSYNRNMPERVPVWHELQLLRRRFPGSKGRLTHEGAEWTFSCRPTPISGEYKVRFKIRELGHPIIEILKPAKLSHGKEGYEFNHMYRDTRNAYQQPCLHALDEWTPKKRIADTLVPWVCEWCFFYEIWLVTGKWMGGGTHNGEYRE